MTDITLWQAALEPSGYVVDPDKLATDLYECSLIIFVRLVQPTQASSTLVPRIRTQLQRFQLWGNDFDAREGGLDEKIVHSDRLKDALLPLLGRMADALVKIAHRRGQDMELEDLTVKVKMLNDQCLTANGRRYAHGEEAEGDLFQIASILDEITSSGSEISSIDEAREIDELLKDVKSCNDCLFDIGSVLQDSAERIVPNSEKIHDSTAVTNELLHNTAWPFISNVLEAYPSIDRDFAQRLGGANERRYNRLQTQRSKAADDDHSSETNTPVKKSLHGSSSSQTSHQASTTFTQSDSSAPSTNISTVFDALSLSTSK